MDQTCDECKRLWRAYAAATTGYMDTDRKLQDAAKADRMDTVAQLAVELEALEAQKLATREAVRQHEQTSGHR